MPYPVIRADSLKSVPDIAAEREPQILNGDSATRRDEFDVRVFEEVFDLCALFLMVF